MLKTYWRRFKRNRLGQAGLSIAAIIVLLAIFAPFIGRHNPVKPDFGAIFQPPSVRHWFGTDSLGRDIFSRILYGARTSLTLSLAIAVLQALVGVVLGLISGAQGGWVDLVIQRLVEIQVTFPRIIGAMIVVAAMGGGSILTVVLALTLVGWAPVARLVRAEVLSLRDEDFIQAAKAIGVPTLRLYMSYYLINVVSIIVVYVTLNTAFNILSLATLSFLGYGLPSSTPEWGGMLQDAQSLNILRTKPWVWLPPGIAISVSVISVNFIGDALRDALDPKYYYKGG